MTKKTILVTGIAGFIGFHLAKACVRAGHTVLGIDNFNDYYTPALKRERAQILGEMGVKVHVLDVTDKEELKKLFHTHSFTHVVHLAAQAGVRFSFAHPEAYVHSNIQGFLALLETMRFFPHIPLVYASSSSVYGHNKKIPFSINDPVDKPANFYGTTKRANELMAFSYHQLYGIPVTGLRFFTVYGPWGRPDMAYFSFTEKILAGQEIEVYNKGIMSRDFTYVDDVVQGIVASLERKEGCALYNLGNHRPEKLMTLVECIEKYSGKKAVMKFLPMQPGEIEATYADIEESTRDLGFCPTTTLDEGMQQFVTWYKNWKQH